MASRRRSGLSALLTSVLLVVAACSPGGTSEATGEGPVLEEATTTASTIELIEGARHMDLRDPEWVSDLIIVWLER